MKDSGYEGEAMRTTTNDSAPRIPYRGHKKLIIVLVILATIAVVTGIIIAIAYSNNLLSRNNIESELINSLQNTLRQQELKFSTELTNDIKISGSDGQQNLKLDGVYKKDAGLSGNANSTASINKFKVSKNSKWVFDSSGKAYVSLSLYEAQAETDSPYAKVPAVNQSIKDTPWIEYATENVGLVTNLYSIPGCALKAYYNTLSSNKEFQSMMAQIVKLSNIQKTSSSAGVSVYTAKIDSKNHDSVISLYKKSSLYKTLANCEKNTYPEIITLKESTGTFNNNLKNVVMTINVDSTKKLIKSLAITGMGPSRLTAEFTPTNNVSLTVPENPVKAQGLQPVKMTQNN